MRIDSITTRAVCVDCAGSRPDGNGGICRPCGYRTGAAARKQQHQGASRGQSVSQRILPLPLAGERAAKSLSYRDLREELQSLNSSGWPPGISLQISSSAVHPLDVLPATWSKSTADELNPLGAPHSSTARLGPNQNNTLGDFRVSWTPEKRLLRGNLRLHGRRILGGFSAFILLTLHGDGC